MGFRGRREQREEGMVCWWRTAAELVAIHCGPSTGLLEVETGTRGHSGKGNRLSEKVKE